MGLGIGLGLGRAPTAAGFAASDPRAYGTPVWWHEASLGVTKNGSNIVSSWADQSGNGNTVTSGAGPLWVATGAGSRPYIEFTNKSLNRALASPLITTDWTLVLVCAKKAAQANGNLLRHGHVANNTGLDVTFIAGARTVTRKGVVVGSDASMTDGTFEVQVLSRAAGAAPVLKVNDGAQALTNSGNTGYNTGANILDYGMSANVCWIAECCAFASVVNASALVAALKTKYGIA